MPASLPFAVFGATGRTGAATADALLRAGQRVRVVVRDASRARAWSARGADVAVADLTDLPAVTAALRDVRGAYVVNPQAYAREDLFAHAEQVAEAIARATAAAAVPRVVALSSVGADRPTGTGWILMNRAFEESLAQAAVPAVFLRAAYFMENWAPLVQQAVASGVLPSFLSPPRRAIPMVATVDVGTAAAALLQAERPGPRAVVLSGPRPCSPHDVAAAVAAVRGRPVDVAVVPEADWGAALAGANFSAAALAGFVELTRGLNDARIDALSDADAGQLFGTTTIQDVVQPLAAR